jgi:hypothetical protein
MKAQFGVGVRYSTMADGYWQELLNDDYADHIATAYAMYWFRLKNKRVEFLPEVGYYHSFSTASFRTGRASDIKAMYLQLNTDIYFLDFDGDCNCPTFSKQGDVFQKGIFAEVSAGAEFRTLEILLYERSFKKTVPKFYGGLGFDIGISDLITVTPTAGVSILPGSAWEGVEEFLDADGSTLNQQGRYRDVIFNGGIRVLFRPDYLKRRR